jgi:hypothetical protein
MQPSQDDRARGGAGVAFADDWPSPRAFVVFSESARYFVRFIPGESIGDTVGFAGAPKGKYATALLYALQADRGYRLEHTRSPPELPLSLVHARAMSSGTPHLTLAFFGIPGINSCTRPQPCFSASGFRVDGVPALPSWLRHGCGWCGDVLVHQNWQRSVTETSAHEHRRATTPGLRDAHKP